MSELLSKVGSVTQDNLIAKILPPAEVTGVLIAKEDAAAATYKRGTVLAQSASDGKCVILGSTAATGDTLTAAYILADDVEVGTDADVSAVAYRSGCFNKEAVTVKDGSSISAADLDNLRKYGIVFADKML